MKSGRIKVIGGILFFTVLLGSGYLYYLLNKPTDESISRLQDNANQLKNEGKLDQAEACFRKSIRQSIELYGQKNVAAATAYAGLGNIYLMKKENAKAADNLLLAADIFRNSLGGKMYPKKVFHLKLQVAQILENIKKYKRAEEEYNFVKKHLITLSPDIQFKYYLYRGNYHYQRHMLFQAKQLLEKAYNLDCYKSTDQTILLYELLGITYNQLEQYKKSVFFLEKLIHIVTKEVGNDSSNIALYYFFLGRSLIGLEQYQQAQKILLKSVFLSENKLKQQKTYSSLLFHTYLYLTHIAIETNDRNQCSRYWEKVEILKKQNVDLNLKTYNLVRKLKKAQQM